MKRTLILAIALCLILSSMTGLTNAYAAESSVREIITVDWDTTDYGKDWWPSEFVEYFQEKLGATIEAIRYDNDTRNLALASGDLSDIMVIQPKVSQQVLQAGYAVALDDYLDKMPNFAGYETRNKILSALLSKDGKTYFHTPSTGPENIYGGTSVWNGYNVRWDYYKEIGAPEITDNDEYVAVLKQMQEKHPTTEDGLPTYGFGIHGGDGLWGWNIRSFANLGYQNVTSWAYAASYIDNNLISNYLDVENAPFYDAMELYNKMYRAGIFDPDSFTMNGEQINEKATNGQYVAAFINWYGGDLYSNSVKEDPNTLAGFISLPAKGSWYGGNHVIGWGDKLSFVTSSAQDIDLAVKFMDLLDDPDINRAQASGIQGKHWDYNAEGVPEAFAETLALRAAGGEEWRKTGIGSFSNMTGGGQFALHTDGYPFYLFGSVDIIVKGLNHLEKDYSDFYGVSYPAERNVNLVKEGKGFDQSNVLVTAINAGFPDAPSDIARIDAQLDELALKAIPGMVMAESNEDFIAARDQFVADCKSIGAETAFEWWKTEWDSVKTKIEEALK